MKAQSLAVGLALADIALAAAGKPVSGNELAKKIVLRDLVAGSKKLESFAAQDPDGSRVFGHKGHQLTVDWLYRELKATGFYNVEKQEQVHLWSHADEDLQVAGQEVPGFAMSFTPSGDVTANVVLVSNLGCAATDFPAEVAGNIALISRGTCPFGDKAAFANQANAAGALIYNNVDGELHGTLGESNPNGPYAPTIGITLADGQAIIAQLEAGPVEAHMVVDSQFENRTTHNVIATSKSGDQNTIIASGAHTDAVDDGPGINDDGSGTVALLNIAKALTKFRLKNAVRFGFWTAEEFGLLGSTFYVESLPAEELAKIRLYLNFDMIASNNYANLIYDGDGDAFNQTGPAGSAEIEALFEGYFDRLGEAHFPTAFDGRSDYLAFIDAGIPAGGIFSGADGIKTEEEVALFGGTAGIPYDPFYHQPNDTLANMNLEAYERNAKGAAFAIGTYAASVASLPPKEPAPETKRRWVPVHKHEGLQKGCSHKDFKYAS